MPNYKKKTLIIVWILIFIVVTIFSVIGSILFANFWFLFLPLSLILIVAFQAMSEQFWTPKKYCPRCQAPVTIYSEYCRNCGLKLINKCPNCGHYQDAKLKECSNCGYKYRLTEMARQKEDIDYQVDYQVIKKGQNLPEKANFCPHCGSTLKNQDYSRGCPHCGKKVD
ncbi:MAG: hypothetical protein GF353_09575 [Candidatus Lokiarchaeota archaeon]|nr:hypothetical protein [Candidatus Lokiarchaeota archaeon]